MDGYINQVAALNYPDRVISLTTIGSSPIQPSCFSTLDNWLLANTPTLLNLYPYHTLVNTIASQIELTRDGRVYARETLLGCTKTKIGGIMGTVYQGLQVYKADFKLPQTLLITYRDADNTGKVQVYCYQWVEADVVTCSRARITI